ncbi:hypothetical protein BK005_00805 [bacterium CG10_37_50]|nr:MAG: hypothetical protein BK005_00805 [bacterium CG10_37_50]
MFTYFILKTLQIGLAGLITAVQINPLMPIDLSNTPATLKSEPPRALTSIEKIIVSTSTKYGLDTEMVLRIAKCESSLRQFDTEGKLIRGKVNPQDVGVFQINERYHLKLSEEMGFDIYSLEGNIDYALWLMKNGGNRHWNSSRSCWQEVIVKNDDASDKTSDSRLLSVVK